MLIFFLHQTDNLVFKLASVSSTSTFLGTTLYLKQKRDREKHFQGKSYYLQLWHPNERGGTPLKKSE